MDVIRKHNIRVKQDGNAEYYRPTAPSAEASICLNCTLPAKKCNPSNCQRYKEEKKKIKEKEHG